MSFRTFVCLAFVFIAHCTAITSGRVAFAADAAKDPCGWGDVRFGMTKEQALAALQGKAQISQRFSQQRELMTPTNNVYDLAGAIAKAKRLTSEAREGDDNPKVQAAQQLLKLTKTRTWMQTGHVDRVRGVDRGPSQQKPKFIQLRVSGVLVDFRDMGANERQLVIQTKGNRNGDTATMRPSLLDEASAKHLQKVDEAIGELAGLLESEKQPIGEDFIVQQVEIRGITFAPKVNFDNGEVSSILLTTPGSDNPMTPVNPNRYAMHDSICNALSDKYGAPDERNQVNEKSRVVWRFPKTVITCSCGRLGLSILYTEALQGEEQRDNL